MRDARLFVAGASASTVLGPVRRNAAAEHRRRRAAVIALAFAAALALAAPPRSAAADPPRVPVRTGDHPGFGRIVFDWPHPPIYEIERAGDRLTLRFGGPAALDLGGAAGRPPRNVRSLAEGADGVELALRPGARVRHLVLGTRLVLDLLDPAGPAREPPVPRPAGTAPGGPAVAAEVPAAAPEVPRAGDEAAPRAAAAPARRRPVPPAVAPASTPPAPGEPARATTVAPGPEVPAASARPAAPVAAAAPARQPTAAADPAATGTRPLSTSGGAAAPAPASPAGGATTAPPALEASAAPASGTPPLAGPTLQVPPSPPSAAPAPTSASAPTGQAAPSSPGPVVGPAPAPAGAATPPALPPVPPPSMDGAARVRLVGPPGPGRSALLPFGEEVGLAVLRRGDALLVVADAPQALDLTALRGDPMFAGLEARVLPGATLLSLPVPDGAPAVVPRRVDGLWALAPVRDGAAPTPPRPVELALEPAAAVGTARLLLRTGRPGRSVTVADPETGLPLLLGTARQPGWGTPQLRRLAEADLLPTGLGVAALARSDRVALTSAPEDAGFVLGAPGRVALALDASAAAAAQAPAGAAAAAGLTRLFDFPALPTPQLLARLRAEQAAASAAPPLARHDLRRAAAQTLLALGLAQEAQATLALALREDPRASTDPTTTALAAAAALLAGRPGEAGALADPALPPRDEAALWRGLLDAARGREREAAPALAAGLPIVLAYPDALRDRLVGPIADALIAAGDTEALRRLFAAAGPRPDLAVARAWLAEAEGRADEALAAYDAVAQGRDRRARADALRRAVELRLATGGLDEAGAARALEAALFAWRGDGREVALRLRVAELRSRSGDGLGALALLREAAAVAPEHAEALRPATQAAFRAALEQAPPLEAVALYDAHPELRPDGAPAEQAAGLIAERLLALDLTARAAAVLRAAAERAAPGPGRATLGLRLARLRLDEGDAAGALAALQAGAADDLPAGLARERAVLGARAQARRGDLPGAAAALDALGPDGAEPLAELLAEARDWPGAARAMARHLRAVAATGGGAAAAPLDDGARRAVLRQAALLALAGDAAGLAALRSGYAPRMAGGALAAPFAALTADPARGLADLPRLQQELQLFRSLPERLEPLRAASLAAR